MLCFRAVAPTLTGCAHQGEPYGCRPHRHSRRNRTPLEAFREEDAAAAFALASPEIQGNMAARGIL